MSDHMEVSDLFGQTETVEVKKKTRAPLIPVREDLPVHTCPECGTEQVDYDGFGLLACVNVSPDGNGKCSYCTHPSYSAQVFRDDAEGTQWRYRCDCCGTWE